MSDTNTLANKWRYEEAAAFLKISPNTLRRKVMLHQVPFMRPFGKKGRVLFSPERLEEFVEASSVEPGTE